MGKKAKEMREWKEKQGEKIEQLKEAKEKKLKEVKSKKEMTEKHILEVKISRTSKDKRVLGYIRHNLEENGQVVLQSRGGANRIARNVADAMKKQEGFREVDKKEGGVTVERNRRSYVVSELRITLEKAA